MICCCTAMELQGKVALVTGASAGIGKETVAKLVGLGLKVIGCARRFEKLKDVAEEINKDGPGEMFPIKCDLRKEDEILEMFSQIKEKYGTLHILINNAGFAANEPLLTGATETWRAMMDVNILASAICGREAYKLMKANGVRNGNFIFIGSIAGRRKVPFSFLNFYSITKSAFASMVELFRREVVSESPEMRCTSVTPGMVRTEAPLGVFPPEVIEKIYEAGNPIDPADVADTIVYILKAPRRLNINDIEPDSSKGCLN